MSSSLSLTKNGRRNKSGIKAVSRACLKLASFSSRMKFYTLASLLFLGATLALTTSDGDPEAEAVMILSTLPCWLVQSWLGMTQWRAPSGSHAVVVGRPCASGSWWQCRQYWTPARCKYSRLCWIVQNLGLLSGYPACIILINFETRVRLSISICTGISVLESEKLQTKSDCRAAKHGALTDYWSQLVKRRPFTVYCVYKFCV